MHTTPWARQRPGVSIGEALTTAKQELGEVHPELLDILLGWTILGGSGLFIEP